MYSIKSLVLIIDMNYILYRNVHILNACNSLDDLYLSLNEALKTITNLYPFNKMYIVSDTRSGSWRKDIFPEYKGNRIKSKDIDWNYVYEVYTEFKDTINDGRINILEGEKVEGDDWIYYLINKYNNKGVSTFTIASDNDLLQESKFSLENSYINIFYADSFKNPILYLPKNSELFLSKIENNKGDLFDMNENYDFITFINSLKTKSIVKYIDNERLLCIKLIQGDNGDNIPSVLQIPTITDPTKFRGIGKTGAEKIYDNYKLDNPQVIDILDNKWLFKLSDYIAENKKVSIDIYQDKIINNLKFNRKLICLDKSFLPEQIYETIWKR